jgi:hypothetical protein
MPEASRGTGHGVAFDQDETKDRPVAEVLGWIFVLSLVLGPWIAWFIGEPNLVREGELCGSGYRWTYAQPKFADSDLSCEPE